MKKPMRRTHIGVTSSMKGISYKEIEKASSVKLSNPEEAEFFNWGKKQQN